MKKEIILIAKYSQEGSREFPEDTWKTSWKCEGEKHLYNKMKLLCKKSARSFNDYPFWGLFTPQNIHFFSQNIITDDDGNIYKGKLVKTARPDYFKAAEDKFKEWYSFLEKRLPKLIIAYEKREKEEREKLLFETLKNKYGI